MAQIGTMDFNSESGETKALAKSLNAVGLACQGISKSLPNKVLERMLTKTIKSINSGAKRKDAFQCFESEKICIFFEKDFFATTEQDHKRLDKQLSENGAAVFSAKLIFESEKYKQHILDIYGPHRKIMFPPAGEPCVTITRKQIQQLARPKTGITSPKIKEFYAARQENLRCALGLCIEAQCKALDIPVPKQGKTKGLEL